jgi:magnesium chelatase family protein
MLARRLPSIMAPLSPEEAVEVTKLYSLAGPLKAGSGFIDRLITRPPLRAPHHSASAEGILGGGRTPRPGEITLAHYGVLFLDEAPEFKKNVLQALREPLEDRVISMSRAEGPVRLPAEFQLLMASNVCPCGRLGMRHDESALADDDAAYGEMQACLCSPEEISRYWRKFGGALLDRIELRVPVIPPRIDEIGMPPRNAEHNADIARRVRAAVEIQRQRFRDLAIRRNALIPAGKMETFCSMSDEARSAFHKALARLGLCGRAYHSIQRVARTIADLDGKGWVDTGHIVGAVQHRRYGEDPYGIITVSNGNR